MILRYTVFALGMILACEAKAQDDMTAARIDCLAVLSAYGSWLERVDSMRLPGVISGFYGNASRELARVDNGRYLLLARLAQTRTPAEMGEHFQTVASAAEDRLEKMEAGAFAAEGLRLRAGFEGCRNFFMPPEERQLAQGAALQ